MSHAKVETVFGSSVPGGMPEQTFRLFALSTEPTVPFYKNPDEDHCLQACLRMALGAVEPDRQYSWAELDRLSFKSPGSWTWPAGTILSLHDLGWYGSRLIDPLDYQRFSQEGEAYLSQYYADPEVAAAVIANTEISQEMGLAAELVEKGLFEQREPEIEDVISVLSKGGLAMAILNARQLQGKAGYEGHFVVLTSFDPGEETVTFHDPGINGENFQERAELAIEAFEEAWQVRSLMVLVPDGAYNFTRESINR